MYRLISGTRHRLIVYTIRPGVNIKTNTLQQDKASLNVKTLLAGHRDKKIFIFNSSKFLYVLRGETSIGQCD